MNSSEELMLLLELNGFDITKFKLKMQLQYEKTGNIELYKHKKYADLVVCHYSFEEDEDYFHRNPLTYRSSWGKDVNSIDQFYIKHPDIEEEMSLKEFLQLKSFNEINRESIIYDVLDSWVEEYREASITQMENLREMVKLLPKKSRKYRKPSKITFLFSIIFALIIMLLFKSPDSLKLNFLGFLGFLSPLIDDYVALLYESSWYSLLGLAAIFLFIIYAVLNNALLRYIREVRSEKNKRAEKTFDKWEKDMKNERLKQAGILEDYVDLVIKKPNKSYLDVTTLMLPEKLLDKFKNYVSMIERRYDWMTKNYKKLFLYIRLIYVLAFLVYLAFFVVGYAVIGGWI